MPRPVLLALSMLCGLPQWAHACWDEVAQRHEVSADLLYAIAKVESNLDPKAVNRSHLSRTDSYDIGLMQINSRHLPRLARRGITEAHLFEPCTNLDVGAWLLADLFSRLGRSWNSVGAYNAACTQLKGDDCARARARYAWKVYRQLPGVTAASRQAGTPRHAAPGIAADIAVPMLAVRVAP
ncbi:lytic transglycosylase domain-containing protein [Pseudothauera nasutitermitis]|uniref:Lytic transglycosylase domain-containing protein n=1 Tax=Pseudothauera nasutitermitis TaxID=2565930 RepID=A0A4S4AZ15_9RHOO|nr:lytic transglycosylase domain-containing protein [Pseudothauera nasutitermitis]THF64946.1 lytic transglycosylase domain-containing protein [Pseudothauera nasutitermitis]